MDLGPYRARLARERALARRLGLGGLVLGGAGLAVVLAAAGLPGGIGGGIALLVAGVACFFAAGRRRLVRVGVRREMREAMRRDRAGRPRRDLRPVPVADDAR